MIKNVRKMIKNCPKNIIVKGVSHIFSNFQGGAVMQYCLLKIQGRSQPLQPFLGGGVSCHTIAYQSQTAAHMITCCTDHRTNSAMISSAIICSATLSSTTVQVEAFLTYIFAYLILAYMLACQLSYLHCLPAVSK